MTIAAQSPPKPPEASFSQLKSSKTSYRLNQIERIRAYGVGELVELPQLVVCGDQSAGKSSVLEGITGIPFPRQDGLCTRFPTEIILQDCSNLQSTQITATIRPHLSRSDDDRKRLESYSKVIQDMSELPSIIQDVSELMGIRGYSAFADASAFARDALRIEVTGPTGLHLSVVDLPGLIAVSSEEQSDEDVDAVHEMVTSYLQSSRTIILAVLQASNDMANQPIIKIARKHDPEGQRTVGIITKPDLINEGTEAKIARVAKNQDSIKLKLGFFLLKNPSPLELKDRMSMKNRSERELLFFKAPAWKRQNLDMDRVGVERLRFFLQDLLDTHLERELPKVRDEIKGKLAETERKLKALGNARPTIGHIRAFVTTMSMTMSQLFQAALDGNYHSIDVDFFSQHDVCRLRARIQEANASFATDMRMYGQRRKLGSIPQSSDSDNESTDETAQFIVSETEMMVWVKQAYLRTRGKELPGNNNSALLSELFHEQSRRWAVIAQGHLRKIKRIVSQWIDLAVSRLVEEARLRVEIETILQGWLEGAEKSAMEELDKLIQDERRSPMTYNHYYTDNVQKDRLKIQQSSIKAAIASVTEYDRHGKLHISNQSDDIGRFISEIESRITVDMDEQACKEAMTQLDAYYKVARKTFVDNVARQVIERHIMSPLPTAFCPSSVSNLSDEELLRIGSEPEQQSTRRNKLSNEADFLRTSLLDLQKSI